MARPSREHLLSEIRRLAEASGGAPLGRERFEEAPGIRSWDWEGRYTARWSEAVREAGHEPGAWQRKQHTDDELVRIFADLTRALGHPPTTAELKLWRRTHPEVPNDKVFSNRFGPKAELESRVLAFARSHDEYTDVAAIYEGATARSPQPKPQADQVVVTGVVYLIRTGEFHKIGKSNDPGRRSYELGLQLPEKHDVVHIIETDDPSGIELRRIGIAGLRPSVLTANGSVWRQATWTRSCGAVICSRSR